MVEWKSFAKRVARVVALGFGIPLLLLVFFAMFFGDSLVFPAARYPNGDWEAGKRLPIPAEEVAITSADGTKLVAWYCHPPNARATILLLPGNGGNVTYRVQFLDAFQRIGIATLALDYRGYGKSEGSANEKGIYADAEAAHAWLVARGVRPESVVLYGESLGGAVAVDLATRVKCAGLIVQCTFSSIADMQRRVIPIPLGWALKTKMKSADKIATLTIPKLHFHSPVDEVVPYGLGKKLFDVAAEPKRWVEYPDIGHNAWPGAHYKEWLAEVSKFVDEVVK